MLVKVCVMPLIYLDFELRRDYIVKNLCVNRDKPKLNCDGKCYLAKRLAAAQEKEQQEAERSFVFQLCETIAEPSSFQKWSYVCEVASGPSGSPTFAYASPLIGRIPAEGLFRPPVHA